jgi:tRNA (mo5U34)-methyltransferase
LILGSEVEYHANISVYNIHELGVDDFDVVIYSGVYYHLKDPLLAFARLRQVMKEGGIIVVEGEVFNAEDSYAKFLFSRGFSENDNYSNWFVPTVPCLREWLQCSFFDIVKEYRPDVIYGDVNYWKHWGGFGRYLLTARAIRRDADDPRDQFSGYDFLECKVKK